MTKQVRDQVIYHILEGTVCELLYLKEEGLVTDIQYEEYLQIAANLLSRLPGDMWHDSLPSPTLKGG